MSMLVQPAGALGVPPELYDIAATIKLPTVGVAAKVAVPLVTELAPEP